MFPWRSNLEVAEHKARDRTERIFHEIRQTLRTTGVDPVFRRRARYDKVFPALWDAVVSNAGSRGLEDAADALRWEAARRANALGAAGASYHARLGPSQLFHVRGALELQRYVAPKVLLLVAAAVQALERDGAAPAAGDRAGGASPTAASDVERQHVRRGAPPRMHAFDLLTSPLETERTRAILEEVASTYALPVPDGTTRMLALWPGYLDMAWCRLKTISASGAYREAAERLRADARGYAASLPYPVPLVRERLEELDRRGAARLESELVRFERALPALLLNVALLELDWHGLEDVERSPFPATFVAATTAA